MSPVLYHDLKIKNIFAKKKKKKKNLGIKIGKQNKQNQNLTKQDTNEQNLTISTREEI